LRSNCVLGDRCDDSTLSTVEEVSSKFKQLHVFTLTPKPQNPVIMINI
jgi:hypothetical protein